MALSQTTLGAGFFIIPTMIRSQESRSIQKDQARPQPSSRYSSEEGDFPVELGRAAGPQKLQKHARSQPDRDLLD
jgi:hypothetical protein